MKSKAIFLIFLIFGCTAWAQKKDPAEAILALEKQRFAAQVKKDTTFLNLLFADDLEYGHSNAETESKKEFIRNLAGGKWNYELMEMEEAKVRFYQQCAIITGIAKVKLKTGDNLLNLRLRYTDVYVKQKGQWKLVSWQSVRMP